MFARLSSTPQQSVFVAHILEVQCDSDVALYNITS